MLKQLGERLQSLRGRTSRLDFARHFGISVSSLTRWEKGERQPDLDFLYNVAISYEISSDWLLLGVGAVPEYTGTFPPRKKTADASAVTQTAKAKHTEFIDTPKKELLTVSETANEVAVSLPLSQVQDMTQRAIRQSQMLDEMDQERWRLRDAKERLSLQVREHLRELEDKDAEIVRLLRENKDLAESNAKLNRKVIDLAASGMGLHKQLEEGQEKGKEP